MKWTGSGDMLSVTPSELTPFQLARPRSLESAVSSLSKMPAPVVLHAGGTDLFAKFNAGLRPASLVSLGRIDALKETRLDDAAVELGAGMTHDAAITDAAVAAIPGLAQAWRHIATVRIRHLGTLGGNLMARHTRYELSILLSALAAEARFVGPKGERIIPVERIWDTDLGETPLLVSVRISREGNPRLDYDRSQRPRFTQALCRRDLSAGPRFRLTLGTEWCRPWCADFAEGDAPDSVLARLDPDFGDAVVGRAYLIRAGAVHLRRQKERLEMTS